MKKTRTTEEDKDYKIIRLEREIEELEDDICVLEGNVERLQELLAEVTA